MSAINYLSLQVTNDVNNVRLIPNQLVIDTDGFLYFDVDKNGIISRIQLGSSDTNNRFIYYTTYRLDEPIPLPVKIVSSQDIKDWEDTMNPTVGSFIYNIHHEIGLVITVLENNTALVQPIDVLGELREKIESIDNTQYVHRYE